MATTTMATARQPFAPLNSSRLQNLTSLKNRQAAIPNTLTSPSKRKAATYLEDDFENIDPVIFLSPKRSKGQDGTSKDSSLKPSTSQFFLKPAPPSPNDYCSALKPVTTNRPILQARSPAPKLKTNVPKSTPTSAPAGRSPTRKRIGILSRRRTASPFTRIDPPKFSTPTGLGFSIDAAISGTIPSYGARQRQAAAVSSALPVTLHEPTSKESWFFEIHEDTEDELATNLMEHSTCTLDISSDEESVERERDMRGKENVPPMDDISQTRTYAASSGNETHPVKAGRRQKAYDEGAIDVDRSPLGEMIAEDFYAEGCDKESVVIVPVDTSPEEETQVEEPVASFEFVAEVKGKGKEIDIDALMSKDNSQPAPTAALLAPIEKAEEGFEIWESGSAKGDE